jgi:hypothetical protein
MNAPRERRSIAHPARRPPLSGPQFVTPAFSHSCEISAPYHNSLRATPLESITHSLSPLKLTLTRGVLSRADFRPVSPLESSAILLSPLELTLTKNALVSPLKLTLTKSLDLKSHRITLLQKRVGAHPGPQARARALRFVTSLLHYLFASSGFLVVASLHLLREENHVKTCSRFISLPAS